MQGFVDSPDTLRTAAIVREYNLLHYLGDDPLDGSKTDVCVALTATLEKGTTRSTLLPTSGRIGSGPIRVAFFPSQLDSLLWHGTDVA